MRFFFILLISLLMAGSVSNAQEITEILTLDDCIKLALENNYELNFARINNQVVQKTYLQSYSNILPTVDVYYGQGRYERGPSSYLGDDFVGVNPALPFTVETTKGRNYYAQAQFGQTLFDGGRWYLNIKKSGIDKESSSFSFRSSRQNVIVTVRQLYMDLLKQEELLEVNRQAVSRSEDQLERVESMHEVGSVAQIDVYRSEVNLGNDRIEMLNQENTVREARRNLNIALGREPETPLKIDANIEFEKEVGELDDLIHTALWNNPDIKTQEMVAKSAKYEVRLAQSTYLPNLSGFYYYNRRVPKFKALYDELDREYYWEIGLRLSWNLFNGFSDHLNVQKSKLNHRYQKQQLDYDKLTLKSTVTNLHQNLKALNEIIEINKTNLASAKEDFRLAEEQYRLGSGTILDLREAQVNLATAEQILVAAEFNAYITYAEIQQALGELTD